MLELHKITRVSQVFTWPYVFILLCDWVQQGGVFKLVLICFVMPIWWQVFLNLKKILNFKHFYTFGSFSQVFGQIKKWLILEFLEIIRMWHLIECPMVFMLLCFWSRQGGVLKLMKDDHFLVFLAVWLLFIKSLRRLRSSLY